MEKINFENLPSTNTPLSAENLNLLQTNVEDAINDNTDMLIGNTSAGNMIVNSIRSKNIFGNYITLNGMFINAGTGTIGSNANGTCVYIPIEANTTYTVSKTKGNRFAIGFTSTTPALNTSLTNVLDDRTATSLTSSSDSNSKYLVIYISLSDTETFANIVATIQVEEGDTATTYSPYQQLDIPTSENFISRVNFVSGEESASGLFRKIGNQVIIMYQGQNKVHNGETLLFTLPEGYRPPTLIVVPFTKWSQAYGQIILYDNGQCKIGNISSTSATGRIAFNMTYTID